MDLSGCLDSFNTGTYTVTRYGVASYGSDGRLDAPSSAPLSVPAVVIPLSGRELQRLPEGLRTSELLQVFSSVALKTQGPGQAPDSIAIDGDAYQVQHVEPWSTLGNYYRAIVAKSGR